MASPPVLNQQPGHDIHHQNHHEHNHGDRDPGMMYNQEWVQDLIAKIQGFIRANVAWLGLDSSTDQRVLDYACGHGTITLGLVSECPKTVFRGLDSHPKQVARYNDEAAKLFGESRDRMHATQGDLDNPLSDLNKAEWSDFDVAIISMALHHVPEPIKMLSQLRERLRLGGTLTVIEWYEENLDPGMMTGSDNLDRDDMIVVNSGEKIWGGFTPRGLSSLLEKAGFTGVEVRTPGVSFQIPDDVGGPMSGANKKLMFSKGVVEKSNA